VNLVIIFVTSVVSLLNLPEKATHLPKSPLTLATKNKGAIEYFTVVYDTKKSCQAQISAFGIPLAIPAPDFQRQHSWRLVMQTMQIELLCQACGCSFAAEPEASFDEVRSRMFRDSSWFALGDGNTFEDMIFSSLMERGAICCPECGDPVSVSEESLNQWAMEMLAGF